MSNEQAPEVIATGVKDLSTTTNIQTPSVTPEPAPVPQPAPTPTPASASKGPNMAEAFQQRIDQLKTSGTEAQKHLIFEIEQYIEKMKPNLEVSDLNLATNQFKLWRLLKWLLNDAPAAEFKVLWTLVLNYFFVHSKGVFSLVRVQRGAENWSSTATELAAFQRLINLILVTCDRSDTNSVRTKVSFDRSLDSTGFSDEARNRLSKFYSV